jgi:23S rRNA pseudouridine1911/1915/1917 synthase
MNSEKINLQGTIPETLANKRLDQTLAKLFPQYSRSLLQRWIDDGQVMVDGKIQRKRREKVLLDQSITIHAKLKPDTRWQAQSIPLDIVYEDKALLIINKPAGLVVHPGAGVPDSTLANALLHHAPELATVPRGGIIHRLDKNTTGLLIIARDVKAHHALTQQMTDRLIQREYEAIVNGMMISGGQVDADIARHPTVRTRMAVVSSGRSAITHYRVIERFRAHTHIRVKLETGRTHQIRVHMAHIRYPIVGDPTYTKKMVVSTKYDEPLRQALSTFNRQALHAIELKLTHPFTQKEMCWQAPLPEDMTTLLNLLRKDTD